MSLESAVMCNSTDPPPADMRNSKDGENRLEGMYTKSSRTRGRTQVSLAVKSSPGTSNRIRASYPYRISETAPWDPLPVHAYILSGSSTANRRLFDDSSGWWENFACCRVLAVVTKSIIGDQLGIDSVFTGLFLAAT
jgi:hypothetical protein